MMKTPRRFAPFPIPGFSSDRRGRGPWPGGVAPAPVPARAGGRWPLALAAGLAGGLCGSAALAGGYVAPIFELAPSAPVATGIAAQGWWMALLPLVFAALGGRDRGGNGLTPLPPDHGGPCFGEGTLIRLDRGWVPVEAVRAGDRAVTSRGLQPVLAVESWRPVDYRDCPVLVGGVRLSPNHGVAAGGALVPAGELGAARAPIDGRRYVHVLVPDHSWLLARAAQGAPVIRAESLRLTADLKLARRFPGLVARHAAAPVAPLRAGVPPRPARIAA